MGPLSTGSSRVPRDGGRVVFVRGDDEGVVDLSAPGVSIRSRVHEYGGGACCLVPSRRAGRLRLRRGIGPTRVVATWAGRDRTPRSRPNPPRASAGRTAASVPVRTVRGWWRCARSHVAGATAPPRRCIVALGTGSATGAGPAGGTGSGNDGESILAEGHDFYGAPRLDPTTQRLAVVAWDHPDMPWDRSAVLVVPLAVTGDADGNLPARRRPASRGRSKRGEDVSVGQPQMAARRPAALRLGSPRMVAAPHAQREARRSASHWHRRRPRRSSTAPIGPWASARWPSSPTASWWPV